MDIFHLTRGQPPQRLESIDAMPADGYLWLDLSRDAIEDGWPVWPKLLTGVDIDPRHLIDSQDAAHKPFFDTAPGYDLLVIEEIAPQDGSFELVTRSAALFLFERLLVTVRAPDNLSVDMLKQRFQDGTTRSPGNVRVLAEILLDFMSERLLAAGEEFNGRLEVLQERLLDPRHPFKDWQLLLDGRRDAYRIENHCKAQLKALERWHRHSGFEWSNPEETRLHDISEHITLLRDASADLERHIEAAIQIYFASTSYRTNEVMRTLTVFSAVFLPLTFLAGVYGMNFQDMPELRLSFGYPALLVLMVVLVILMLRYFRKRGYL